MVVVVLVEELAATVVVVTNVGACVALASPFRTVSKVSITPDEGEVFVLEVSVPEPDDGDDSTGVVEFGTVVTVGAVVGGGEVVVVDALGVTAELIFE